MYNCGLDSARVRPIKPECFLELEVEGRFCEVVVIRDTNNNQMESFNGNTVRHREKVVRGLKKEDSAILTGLRLYHNHVRPHLGLPGNMMPGEAAGIHIDGDNKRKTVIQAAAKAEAEATA